VNREKRRIRNLAKPYFEPRSKARAVPWDLADLPGADEQTVFVGIDLGHDHARDRSQIRNGR
jgi:hypothetical protein